MQIGKKKSFGMVKLDWKIWFKKDFFFFVMEKKSGILF